MSDTLAVFPWDTGCTFRVLGYGAGHSQLTLFGKGGDDGAFVVLFEAVEFMRLHPKYQQAVFRLATEAEEPEFGKLPATKLLRIAVSSPTNTGLIACWQMTARRASPDDYRDEGEVLIQVRSNEL